MMMIRIKEVYVRVCGWQALVLRVAGRHGLRRRRSTGSGDNSGASNCSPWRFNAPRSGRNQERLRSQVLRTCVFAHGGGVQTYTRSQCLRVSEHRVYSSLQSRLQRLVGPSHYHCDRCCCRRFQPRRTIAYCTPPANLTLSFFVEEPFRRLTMSESRSLTG